MVNPIALALDTTLLFTVQGRAADPWQKLRSIVGL